MPGPAAAPSLVAHHDPVRSTSPMKFSPTLQDFVLNLIYDPAARSAFEIDPHATLEAAGLGDVTAADVQDVLPLVLDYAPLSNVPALDGLTQVDDLTTGVANLDVAGAVAHLQTITAQIGGTGSHLTGDLNIAAATTVTADHLVSGVLGGGSLTGGSGPPRRPLGHARLGGTRLRGLRPGPTGRGPPPPGGGGPRAARRDPRGPGA